MGTFLTITPGGASTGGTHFVVVDNHGVMLDLSTVTGVLHDPTFARVEWGDLMDNSSAKEFGLIRLRDGTTRIFYDKTLIQPYVDAHGAKRAEHDKAQADFKAAEIAAAAQAAADAAKAAHQPAR